MAGPSRFSNIEAEPVKVTEATKVTGPRRLTLRLSEPTNLGERYAELDVSEEVLSQQVVPVKDVLMTAYNRLQQMLEPNDSHE